MAEIDRRVRYLTKRLDEFTIVDSSPNDTSKVFFGAYVTLTKETGSETEEPVIYQIVGPDEFDLRKNKLSMDSPLAKALLGKRIDDEITIKIPDGTQYYYIENIEYR